MIRVGALAAASICLAAAGCSEPCCTFDSRPIGLVRGPAGELFARVSEGGGPGGEVWPALLDTGTPITIWEEGATGVPVVRERTVRLVGAADPAPTRAIFRRVDTVGGTLSPVGAADLAVRPRALLGGDLLVSFSVEIGFRAPEVTFWSWQPATEAFLSAAGYAVLRIERRGGGELEARSPSDGLGPAGPHQYPPSLLVLRACAAPAAFAREEPLPASCCRGEERRLATGADLSLVLGTGTGPLVLGRAAWERVKQHLPPAPAPTRAPLFLATSREPIAAEWTKLPRLALVDRQVEPEADPGPCVELGRARRLEQVAFRQSQNAETAACALPCDLDGPSSGRAHNSAGYLELGGDLDVAVIDDREPVLQTLRQEIRPEGPEVAGIVGAGTLREARVELDYRSQPARAIFSCEPGAPGERCRTAGRCPRLPGRGQTHSCFGLPAHGLPRMCDNQPTSCR